VAAAASPAPASAATSSATRRPRRRRGGEAAGSATGAGAACTGSGSRSRSTGGGAGATRSAGAGSGSGSGSCSGSGAGSGSASASASGCTSSGSGSAGFGATGRAGSGSRASRSRRCGSTSTSSGLTTSSFPAACSEETGGDAVSDIGRANVSLGSAATDIRTTARWPRLPVTPARSLPRKKPAWRGGRFRPPLRPARSRLRAPESLGGISTYSRSAPGGSRRLSAAARGAQAPVARKKALVAARALACGYDRP
jgi:hypothetical protein